MPLAVRRWPEIHNKRGDLRCVKVSYKQAELNVAGDREPQSSQWGSSRSGPGACTCRSAALGGVAMRSHGAAIVRRMACLKRAALALCIAVAVGGCGETGDEAAKRLDQAIRAEIPAIATRQQAEAWLEARDFKHSYSTDTTGDRFGSQTAAMRVGLRDEDLGGMVVGMIVNTAGIRGSGRLSICFLFDKQGVCVGHLVDWFEYEL